MSDDHIIALIRNGGHPELGMVYEKYRTEFIQWVTKEFRCSEDDGKDIYQLTILIFYENIRSGKLEHLVSSVKTYLFGIGKNVARDNMRKSRRNTAINQEKWLKEYLVDDIDEPVDESMFTMARQALAALGEPCKQLLELYYYDRRSMEEISDRLNYKNADTAKNQKCKCMARLRKLFEREAHAAHIPTEI